MTIPSANVPPGDDGAARSGRRTSTTDYSSTSHVSGPAAFGLAMLAAGLAFVAGYGLRPMMAPHPAELRVQDGSATLTHGDPAREPSVAEPGEPPAEPQRLPPSHATRKETVSTPAAPFDIDAAETQLVSLTPAVRACNETPFGGVATVEVTFAADGRVTSAVVEGPPVAGKPVGSCIANTLRSARIPAFDGDLVTVKKRIPLG